MHQNRASPFASDFLQQTRVSQGTPQRGPFFTNFLRRRNRGSLAFFAEEIAHLGASKNRATLGER